MSVESGETSNEIGSQVLFLQPFSIALPPEIMDPLPVILTQIKLVKSNLYRTRLAQERLLS